MKRFIGLLILIATLSVAFVVPAHATASWSCTFSFAGQLAGWTIGTNTGGSSPFGTVTGTGIQHTQAQSPAGSGAWFRRVDLDHTIASTTITHIGATFDYTYGSPNIGSGTDPYLSFSVGGSSVYSQTRTQMSTASGSNVFREWDGSSTGTTVSVSIISDTRTTNSGYTGAVLIKSISVSGLGDNPFTETTGVSCDEVDGYVRPLEADDVHLDIQPYSSGILQAQNTLIGLSKAAGAFVHAGFDGTVVEVRRMNMNDCAYYLQSPLVPEPIMIVCWVWVENGAYLLPGGALNLQVDVVKIENESGVRLDYLVANAANYVTQGQTIKAGCWLGETFRYEAIGPDVGVGSDGLGVSASAVDISKGMVVVAKEGGGSLVAADDDFTIEATDSSPCNAPEGYDNCQGDASLTHLSQWVTLNVTPTNPGADILPGGYIKTEMNLSQTREPGLKVSVRSVGGTGNIRLTLGQTVSNFTLASSPDPSTVSIAPDDHEPDTSFYTIQVSNTGNSTLNVRFICVHMAYDSGGSPTETPPGPRDTPNDNNSLCRLSDYSFDEPSGIWTLSSGETASGEVRIPDSATVGQSVSIPAGTYTVSVVAAVWHYTSYSPNETSSDTVTLEQDYPADSSYTTIEAKTFGDFAVNNNTLVFTGTLTLGSDSSGTFNLRPVLSSTPTGVRGVIIRSICVGDSGGGGGGSGGGGAGGSGSDWEGPFETSCQKISEPTGATDFGTWTRWLWARFNQFHQCDLMVALNGMYNALQKLVLLVSWSIRWSHEFASRGVTWFTRDFTFWLGGQIANMGGATLAVGDTVYGNVTASLPDWIWDPVSAGMQAGNATREAIEEGKSINDIILDTLQPIADIINAIQNLLNLAFNFLFDIVPRLVHIGYNVVVSIFNNIGAFFDLVVQLFQSYNDAEPQPIAGVMQCATNPKENPVCILLWTLEHTVFSGRGYLLIPFLVVYWTVLLVIWTVHRVSTKLRGSAGQV